MSLKPKEIKNMPEKEREEKLNELKIQLIKIRAKPGKIKPKEIKKAIARLLTFKRMAKSNSTGGIK